MIKFLKVFCILNLFFLFTCCKTPVDVVYFQGIENLEKVPVKSNEPSVFKVDDIVSIYVSAPDMDTARPFNLSQGLSIEGENNGEQSQTASKPTYLIDSEGNIEFPVLGKIKISGLTRIEATSVIKEKLKEYINNPVITLRLDNFKITVLGEVATPGGFSFDSEKVTIIDAIALAGDLTIKGKRNNVIVIRDLGTEKVYHKLDLTSKEIFNSPAYFLDPNDIVYVEPNDSKIRTSKANANTFTIALTLLGVLLSVVSLF